MSTNQSIKNPNVSTLGAVNTPLTAKTVSLQSTYLIRKEPYTQ